jgi:hypothetical protein
MNAPKEFSDLSSFAAHLGALEFAAHKAIRRGLEQALVLIENDAKGQIGHYQAEAGSFPAWAPLAESTEAEKARLGYPADAPLLRTGAMQASFGHTVESDTEGVVGSTDPTLIFHEFGTRKMPPRPVLGPAVFHTREQIEKLLGRAIVEGVLGGQVVDHGGYFGEDIGS